MAYLLHLDTATDRGLYFIAQDGHILAQKDSGDNRDHAATLPGIVADLLRETNLSFTDLSAFAFGGVARLPWVARPLGDTDDDPPPDPPAEGPR